MIAIPLVLLAAAPPSFISAGPLELRPVISETAQLFHIVDQLSGWSPFSHPQYRKHFAAAEQGGLSPADLALLEEHAQLRRRLQYGALDETFYAEGALEQVLAEAMATERLSAAEVELERRVLTHFEPRVLKFVRGHRLHLEQLVRSIQRARPQLERFAKDAARFWGGDKLSLPVYLISSPGTGTGGGGFNGGRLALEVVANQQATEVLLHESWHALAEAKRSLLLEAVRFTPGLDFETLSEGLAYAVSPGLYRFQTEKGDYLHRRLREDIAQSKSFLHEPYVRFVRLGLAIRPLVKEALSRPDGTVEQLLPHVVSVFRGLHAVAEAQERTERGYFVFGREGKKVAQTLADQGNDVWSRALEDSQWENLRPRIRDQDVVVLVLEPQSLPGPHTSFRKLGAGQWAALTRVLAKQKQGEWLLQEGSPRVVALWGPSPEELAAASSLLAPTSH